MHIIDVVLISIIGIIEGITEWLPISSTGHMMIFEHFFGGAFTEGFFTSDFKDMFEYLIQLGAIIAVIVAFWKRVFPFTLEKREKIGENGQTITRNAVASKPEVWQTWLKVLVACVPAVVAVVADKLFDNLGETGKIIVVGAMLALYGVAFIVVERLHKNKEPKTGTVGEITLKQAFFIGCFQVLAAVPGTSRSGVTIIGASGYKILKFILRGGEITVPQISAIALGMVIAFVVSLFVIKFLTEFVKKHDFEPFGWYRIVLGILVIVLCLAF